MYIKIYQLDEQFKDVVNEMGGSITSINGVSVIDVIFSTKSRVSMVTMNNDCVGFTTPKNVGFVASSDDFMSIEIF